jgi:membrane protein required for colicin V production
MPVNWFDILLIIVLVVGLVIGYVQGLVRQVIGLAALYVGSVLATQYFHVVAGFFVGLFKSTPVTLLNMLGFFTILFIVIALINTLALDAYKLTKLRMIPLLDHLIGMLIGLVSTWLLLTIALNVLAFALSAPSWESGEGLHQLLKNGLGGSHLAEATNATLPSILAVIKPWLPSGLPAIFNL